MFLVFITVLVTCFSTYKLITCWLVNYQQIKYLVFFTRKYFFTVFSCGIYYKRLFRIRCHREVCMNEMADISCTFIIWFYLLLLDKSFCCSICDSIIIWSQANIVIKFLLKNLTFKQQTVAHAFLIINRAFE